MPIYLSQEEDACSSGQEEQDAPGEQGQQEEAEEEGSDRRCGGSCVQGVFFCIQKNPSTTQAIIRIPYHIYLITIAYTN